MEENIFDKLGESYDKIFPSHIFEYYLTERIKLIQKILSKSKVKILDVGCGTGTLIYHLNKLGYDAYGIDNSFKMVEIANKKNPGKVKKGDMLNLEFKNQSFDLVISIVSLHHLGNLNRVEKAVNEMIRVTKKSGFILIWEHNPFNPYWYFLMKKVPQDIGEEKLIPLWIIIKIFKKNNIKIEKILKTGFVPDFAPEWSLPILKFLEKGIKKLPLLSMFLLAHNVIIGKKE
ncbi:MAG: class I SAM-dependent methyltransferase [Candidatus Omnitrophica bacterium]|nr:class I SAM-dependent methyltransferase [Candidatus Omnitrophota bacterium]